jgi:hypothetical protein
VIEQLSGTVGRSDLAGHATIVKRHGRTRITGALTSDRFDIDDLSSDAGKRRGAAQKARLGPRLLPGSAIDLGHVRRTDGTLDLRVAHLLWPGPSPFRSMKAHLVLDHSRLVLDPLTLGLTHGTFAGRLRIDQTRKDQRDPRLDIDLAMRGRGCSTSSRARGSTAACSGGWRSADMATRCAPPSAGAAEPWRWSGAMAPFRRAPPRCLGRMSAAGSRRASRRWPACAAWWCGWTCARAWHAPRR